MGVFSSYLSTDRFIRLFIHLSFYHFFCYCYHHDLLFIYFFWGGGGGVVNMANTSSVLMVAVHLLTSLFCNEAGSMCVNAAYFALYTPVFVSSARD